MGLANGGVKNNDIDCKSGRSGDSTLAKYFSSFDPYTSDSALTEYPGENASNIVPNVHQENISKDSGGSGECSFGQYFSSSPYSTVDTHTESVQ